MTECTRQSLEFHPLARRKVTARFDAPAITSDAGGLLLREVDAKFGLIKQLAEGFHDYRRPWLTQHSLEVLLSQRVFGIALGYEDLNDHEDLRYDPLMAVLAGKTDPAPEEGFALAGRKEKGTFYFWPAAVFARMPSCQELPERPVETISTMSSTGAMVTNRCFMKRANMLPSSN